MLDIPESLHRALSLVWVHRGRPRAAIDHAVLTAVEAKLGGALPAPFLAYVCATTDDPSATLQSLARSFAEQSADESEHERDHVPDGYAPLLGLATDEVRGYRMEMLFALGTEADEVVAWNWKGDAGTDVFDAYFDRYDAPAWSQGSFEHLVWWRFGDRERLLPSDATDDDKRALRQAALWNENPRLDLTRPADPGFKPQVRGGVRAPAAVIRVQHPKFGPGVVLRELPGDKVAVKFDADEQPRTLLRRFVTETREA